MKCSMSSLIGIGRLALLTEVTHSNTVDGEPIVLNQKQCQYLAHTCMSWLKQVNLSSPPDPLVKELDGTLSKILSYFKSCTEDVWLSSLAAHLDPHEAYPLHLKDFMVCMATSLALDQHLSNALPFVDCFFQSMLDCEKAMAHSELEEHIQADQEEMLRLLRSTQKKHNVHEEQVSKLGCLTTFFKKKKPNVRPRLQSPSLNNSRVADFLARKYDEIVSLSASPKSAPKAFCIDSNELSVLNGSIIGVGGFSKVYEQTWLGQTVAVKEYDTEDETFIRETSLLAGLRNPYIIKLIGWSRNEAKGTNLLVMERMDKGLHDYMSWNSPSLDVAVDIILQISRGMEYLHRMHVIHRDLKPPNVLVRSCSHKVGYLRIKLSDFGRSKYQPETPFFSTEREGTLYYRAPEVLQYAESVDGEGVNVVFKKYTMKADVFSFAILCYEIIAERAPECFLCTPKEFFNRVTKNVRPELPDSCPPLLADCIKRCWHSQPSHRPSFAELSKVLEYMKSELTALTSPAVAGDSAVFSKFVNEVVEEGDEGDDLPL
eukprot:c20259_g1_i3 orf=297-1925(+)